MIHQTEKVYLWMMAGTAREESGISIRFGRYEREELPKKRENGFMKEGSNDG
jgi:hypothetical protein